MKTLLLSFLFIAGAFAIQAQDAKPTKEQTIEFITSYVKNADSKLLENIEGYSADKWIQIRERSYSNFKISGANLEAIGRSRLHYINYVRNVDRYEEERNEAIEIDLSKVDIIYCIPLKNKDESSITCSLISFHIPSDGPTSIGQPIAVVGNISEESQIYKAFDHLRKLCGAPEPIKF